MVLIPIFILASFLILTLLGIPIFFTMLTASMLFIIIFENDLSLLLIPFNQLFSGFSFSLLAIFFFVQLGYIMTETKIALYLINFIRALIKPFFKIGRVGTITILACAATGTLTGSVIGTTTAVGGITIPQMNRLGYDPEYSSTLLAYSGILGSLIPPSISGLIYAVTLRISVLTTWMAVAGAGILYTLILIIGNLIISKKRKYEYYDDPNEKSTWSVSDILKALPASIVPIGVLGSIYGGICTATEAGAIGVLLTLLLGLFFYKTINSFKQMREILYKSAYQTGIIMALICASFALSHCLTVTGSIKAISRAMLLLTDNKYVLLLITEALLLMLGCFLDDTPIMILLGPIASAILIPVGIHPFHLAAVFVFVCLVGLVTPPVGVGLYAASAVSGVSVTRMWIHIYKFFLPALVVILLITFIPEIVLFLPKIFGLI